MEIPVFSFAAYSGTGKTTLIEKLIPELKSRGLRVAVVKRDAHDFEIDREGKDSWRITKAGADVTAVCSGTKAVIMENRPVPADSLIGRLYDVDIVLVEGYKQGPYRKIALLREGSGSGFAVDPADCFAVMSDVPLENTTVPCFDLNDVKKLAELMLSVPEFDYVKRKEDAL